MINVIITKADVSRTVRIAAKTNAVTPDQKLSWALLIADNNFLKWCGK